MKVLIIEDEAPAFRRLQKILEEIDSNIEIIEVLDSVSDSSHWLQNHHPPDLIFMDIQLSDGISFDIFEKVKVSSPVIFTTAFDEYTLKAFKVNSIDYLLKPIKKEALLFSIEKLKSFGNLFHQSDSNGQGLTELLKHINLHEKQYKNRFLVKMGERLMSVQTEDICYFHLKQGVVHFMTSNGNSYYIDHSLDELTALLDPSQFFRANRQYLIAYHTVQMVHKYHKGKLLLELKENTQDPIIISMEKATSFKKWLDQ